MGKKSSVYGVDSFELTNSDIELVFSQLDHHQADSTSQE